MQGKSVRSSAMLLLQNAAQDREPDSGCRSEDASRNLGSGAEGSVSFFTARIHVNKTVRNCRESR